MKTVWTVHLQDYQDHECPEDTRLGIFSSKKKALAAVRAAYPTFSYLKYESKSGDVIWFTESRFSRARIAIDSDTLDVLNSNTED